MCWLAHKDHQDRQTESWSGGMAEVPIDWIWEEMEGGEEQLTDDGVSKAGIFLYQV